MKKFLTYIDTLKEEFEQDTLEEGKFKNLALGALASASLIGSQPKAEQPSEKPEISQTQSDDITLRVAKNYIAHNEGEKFELYKDSKGKWTIGVGHLVQDDEMEKFKNGIDKTQSQELFNQDIQKHLKRAKELFPNYDTYLPKVKAAILDGVFRGDLSGSPKTIKLINDGKWLEASEEYIDNKEYRASKALGDKHGVWKRMDKNAAIFKQYGEHLNKGNE